MLLKLIITEFKQAKRDPMYIVFLIYPLVLGVAALFLNDFLADQPKTVLQIVQVIFILMNGFLFGALSGFSLLDDKDDFVLMSLKITPMKLSTYVTYKILISFIFSLVASTVMMFALKLYTIHIFDFISIIILSALQAPVVALIITAFARNKVEGFVIMKSSALLLMGPIIGLFVFDIKEVMLYLFPGFYPIRILTTNQLSRAFVFDQSYVYAFLGLSISILITTILFKVYMSKLKKIS